MSVIILSRRFNINPDNIATPIAASLGDLVTLTILSLLCTFLYSISELTRPSKSAFKCQLTRHFSTSFPETFTLIPVSIITVFALLVPLYIYYSHKNEFVRDALHDSWTPIILAMLISRYVSNLERVIVGVSNQLSVIPKQKHGRLPDGIRRRNLQEHRRLSASRERRRWKSSRHIRLASLHGSSSNKLTGHEGLVGAEEVVPIPLGDILRKVE